MTIEPKISCEVSACRYFKIVDRTVYTEMEPKNYFGRAYFYKREGAVGHGSSLSNVQSESLYMEFSNDGIYRISMAIAPSYKPAGIYPEGSVVIGIATPGVIDPGDPPIDYSLGIGEAKFYVALEDTPGPLTKNNAKWQEIQDVYASLAIFEADPDCKVVWLDEIVDCNIFTVKRTACRIFEVASTGSTQYRVDIYDFKGYLSGEAIYRFYPNWVGNKIVLDFNTIAPGDLSNIYIVKFVNESDRSDFEHLVIYDLCRAMECQSRLILELLCKECESCRPSREEEFKRYSLNRMVALMSSIMMLIHQAEFMNIGDVNISDDRYTSIKEASIKLQQFLDLIHRCGECEEVLNDCKGC